MMSPEMIAVAIARRIVNNASQDPKRVTPEQMAKIAAALNFSATIKDGRIICTAEGRTTSVTIEQIRRIINLLLRKMSLVRRASAG